MTPRYVIRRNGTYYFRVRIPSDLRNRIPQREIKVSTKTKEPLLAMARASIIAAFVFNQLHKLRQGTHCVSAHDDDNSLWERRDFTAIKFGGFEFEADFDGDPAKEMAQIKSALKELSEAGFLRSDSTSLSVATSSVGVPATAPYDPTNADSQKLISVLFNEFFDYCLDSRNRGWRDATLTDYQDTKALYIDYLGADKPLQQITLSEHTGFRKTLMELPANRSKKADYRGKSVAQLLGMNIPEQHCMSKTTINNHLTRLNAFYSWLRKKQLTTLPVLDKLGGKSDKKASELRAIFDKEDLKRIFSNEKFTRGKFLHDYYYWIPLLALYTGCRLRELCQLAPDDVKMDRETEVFYLDINDETSSAMKQQGFRKSLKTTNSRRLVPLHPHLRLLGLMEFVEQAKAENRATLFSVKPGQDGDAGVYVSKWFQRFRNQIDLDTRPGVKKDFHSFRHTFINKLEDCGVHPDLNRDIAGHAHQDTNRSTYRKTAQLTKLYEAICQIDFEDELRYVKPYPNTR